MKYVFWQNELCILHSAFLRNLSEITNVTIVSEVGLSETRKKHGFYLPCFGKADVIISPSYEVIDRLLSLNNTVHIFSGVQAFKMPNMVFKLVVKRNLTIGIFSEPFNWMGIKGKLRFVKYSLFRLRYEKYVRFILTTGERGRWCFETAGFRKEIIYDWAYFTETPVLTNQKHQGDPLKILFIGSIDERKNILSLVSVCKKLSLIDHLQIIGTGSLENELKQVIQNSSCKYWGRVDNRDVHNIIADSDVLVLPSIYDGWGAVVNEALMCGIPVIASENCGSSILLKGMRGRTFSIEKNDLEKVFKEFIPLLPYNPRRRGDIKQWANENISGEVAVKYFCEIMAHVFYHTVTKPIAPWLR